jgi:hypothetical protein
VAASGLAPALTTPCVALTLSSAVSTPVCAVSAVIAVAVTSAGRVACFISVVGIAVAVTSFVVPAFVKATLVGVAV